MAVGITLADATVAAVDEEFRTLVSSDLATFLDSFGLGAVDGGGAFASFGLDGPSCRMGNYVLVLALHRLRPDRREPAESPVRLLL